MASNLQQLALGSTVRLNNGVRMPVIGFGTWRLQGTAARDGVVTAVRAGCRLIDTASAYGNEAGVGEGVRSGGVPREELFITSKLWGHEHGREEAKEACSRSLGRLGLDYLDLYLIHWPSGGRNLETWQGMIELLEEGMVRSIGVSNFSMQDIAPLVEGTGTVPAVDQVEYNPYRHDDVLLSECSRAGIQLEAYSPLSATNLHDPVITGIAARQRRSPAQVVLRWCLQKGTVVLYRSSRPEHIVENSRVFDFELPPGDMKALDSLG